jgi:hypothetical protein
MHSTIIRLMKKRDAFSLLAVVIAVAGILQFAQGIWMAIEHYPGGFNPALQFLSQLGSNSWTSPYFTRATVVLGVSLWPFFYSIVHKFGDDVPGHVVLFSGYGIISSLGLCGIGATPYHEYPVPHLTAIVVWLIPMLLMLRLDVPQPVNDQSHGGSRFSEPITCLTIAYVVGMLAMFCFSWKLRVVATISQKLLILAVLVWLLSLLRVLAVTASASRESLGRDRMGESP